MNFTFDIPSQISAYQRSVSVVNDELSNGTEQVQVLLRRRYEAPLANVWDALTNPQQIPRWFLPISGDLREGGNFALEGNAGGDILVCQSPTLLRTTFGDPNSLLSLQLSEVSDGKATELTLDHRVPLAFAGNGSGALYVGPGWEGAMMGLALFLDGIVAENPAEVAGSIEVQQMHAQSISAWRAVILDSGTATEDETAASVEIAMATFAPAVVEQQAAAAQAE